MKKQVFITDDHALFCKSLEMLINSFEDYSVGFIASNGKELIFRLQNPSLDAPDIILLDLNMPVMNGLETMDWIAANKPAIPVIVLSMQDNDDLILKMVKKGIKGYLLKDITPQLLKKALDDTLNYGFYHSEKVTRALVKSLSPEMSPVVNLKDKEIEFIKLACSEMTYKEIADKMHLSPKTIDGYRQVLFDKLDIKSRVGLVLYALKNNLFII